jgi:hypothetical protein
METPSAAIEAAAPSRVGRIIRKVFLLEGGPSSIGFQRRRAKAEFVFNYGKLTDSA